MAATTGASGHDQKWDDEVELRVLNAKTRTDCVWKDIWEGRTDITAPLRQVSQRCTSIMRVAPPSLAALGLWVASMMTAAVIKAFVAYKPGTIMIRICPGDRALERRTRWMDLQVTGSP